MSTPPIQPLSRTPMDYDPPDSLRDDMDRATWLEFAAILLFLVGTFNIIDGIAAIRDSKYVVNQVLFSNLHAWGWFFLIWGILQIVAAFAVYKGARWAVYAALVTVFFNAIAHLSAAKTYPVWSITIVVLDVVIMYGLVVHSGRKVST